MIVGDGANGVEAAKVVLERIVGTVPTDNVKGRVVLRGGKEFASEFACDLPGNASISPAAIFDFFILMFIVIKSGNRDLEIPRICQPVTPYRSQLG